MPVKKYPIEWYKSYQISIISGISPTMFTAEKADASKGVTLTEEDLDKLKDAIDEKMSYASSIKINVHEDFERNSVIQDVRIHINLNGVRYNGLSVVVHGDAEADYDLVLDMFFKKRARMSKGQKRKGNSFNKKNLMMLHTCTITGERR